MAIASKAQLKKLQDLRKAGKISLAQIAHMSRGTDLKSLPERVDEKE